MKSFWSLDPSVWQQSLLRKRYKVIYAEPPWKVADNRETILSRHKRFLNAIDLASLPVWELVDDDAVLALWWPSNMPMEALSVMKQWGFRLYRMNGLTWIRQGREKSESELCLFAVRGDGIEYFRDWRASSIVTEQLRRSGEKPTQARDLLDRLVPAQPKLELFVDSGREDWDSWVPNSSEGLN